MATRVRQSTEHGTPRTRQSLDTSASRVGRASTAQGRQPSSTATPAPGRATNQQLPPYEKPVFTLNPAAQRAIAALSQTSSLKKLDKHLADAQAAVSNAAAEINDRLTSTEQQIAQLTRNHAADSEDAAQATRNLEQLRERVDKMTNRMDESMRKLIDGQHGVRFIKDSVATTAEDARTNASTQASTQNVRTQRSQWRTRRTDAGSGSDEDVESEEEYPEFQPTDPTSGTQPTRSTIETFRTKLDNEKTRYQSNTLHDRYAENEDYCEFRKVVHDARHPENDVPMPNARDWFPEGDVPAPGITARPQQGEDDDDDDIAIERANISTKCPLTLQEFKTVLSSKKCQHSFEKDAILGMIRQGGSVGVRCPVPGCGQMLKKEDLHIDAVTTRRVKRLQKAKALEEEQAYEDEVNGVNGHGRSQRNATLLSDDDNEDVDAIVQRQRTQLKKEPPATGRSAAGGAERRLPTRSTQPIEVEGNDSEEEEE